MMQQPFLYGKIFTEMYDIWNTGRPRIPGQLLDTIVMCVEKVPSRTLSLIGTVFNNGAVVEASLNSLITGLSDVLERYEIVIVDNFSTDFTYEKIVQLAKKHPQLKVYREHCNRGQGRQIALQNSSGHYVMPVDFDSIYSPEFFKLLVS